MKSNLSYLRSLTLRAISSGTIKWPNQLLDVLDSADAEELWSNPQTCRVSFVKERAEQRLRLSSAQGLTTFGIPELIDNIGSIADDESIELFGIKNSKYIGTCFVYNKKIIGCEFVLRGKAISKPGLWLNTEEPN